MITGTKRRVLKGSLPYFIIGGSSVLSLASLFGFLPNDISLLGAKYLQPSRYASASSSIVAAAFVLNRLPGFATDISGSLKGAALISSELYTRSASTPAIEEINHAATILEDYVEVNLDSKTVTLYHADGETIALPIVSIGKPGSYYETIGGDFVMDYKIPLHFSSIGHVYMPFSVHLFGNYFIHGIPYYENGERVSSEYSGGCIRMEDADAERLFNFVKRGSRISVIRPNVRPDYATEPSARNFSISNETKNKLSANKIAVIDTDTGKQLLDVDTNTTIHSEELLRNMIAIVSLETQNQDKALPSPFVAENVSTSTVTRKSLIDDVILFGDRQILKWFASGVGERQFVSLLNQRVVTLGMNSTVFDDVANAPITTVSDELILLTFIAKFKSYLAREGFRTVDKSTGSAYVIRKVETKNGPLNVAIVVHDASDVSGDIETILNDLSGQ